MNPLSRLLLAWALLQGREDAIEPGEIVRGTLRPSDPVLSGHGPSKRYTLQAAKDGQLTISLESHDFDAFLRIESGAGGKLAEDDNGGIETSARVVLEAKTDTRYDILVAAASKDGAGEFTLSAAVGEVPRAQGVALSEAAVTFRQKASERALKRGDNRAAAEHRLEEGNRLLERSRSKEAKGAYESCLSIARDAGHRTLEARALGSIGTVLQHLGDYPGSRDSQEKALAIFVDLGDREMEGRCRGNLGLLYQALGDYPRARENHEKSLALARETGDRLAESAALEHLGLLLTRLGAHAKAREHLETCLFLARELKDRELEAGALDALGSIHYASRDYPHAREQYGLSLALRKELGDRQGEASTLGNLGLVHYSTGDFVQAKENLEASLALAREVGARSVELNALGNLGNVYVSIGDLPRALEHYENVLVLAKAEGHRDLAANTTMNLGTVHLDLGDYPAAVERYGEALALFREMGNRAGELFILLNLGKVRSELGDHGGAKELTERALELARDIGDRYGEATALGNLGVMHSHMGNAARALELHEMRLALSRELGDKVGEATTLGNLGAVHARLGEERESVECHEKSLALARELGDRSEEARALGNLGIGHWRRGEISEAHRQATAARALYLEAGAEQAALDPSMTLARLAIEERDPARAGAALRQATDILDRGTSRGLEISEASGLRSEHAGWEEVAHDLTALRLAEAGSDAKKRLAALAEGFREGGRWKGRALLEGIAEHRRGGRSADAIEIRKKIRESIARRDGVLDRVSKAVREGKPSAEIEALRKEASEHLARADALRGMLLEVSPRDAALDSPLGEAPETVRKATVGKGTALIEYAAGEKRLFAYVLTTTGLGFLDLGDRTVIAETVEEFLSRVTDPASLGTVEEIAKAGTALFDALLAPALREAGEGINSLVIIPTGSLSGLPFEALVAGVKGSGGRAFKDLEFVLEHWAVSYAPSSSVLVEATRLGERAKSGKTLVLADPVYPSETGAKKDIPKPAEISLRAIPLPGNLLRIEKTRSEALAIGRIILAEEPGSAEELARLGAARSGSLSLGSLDLHLGEEASREKLSGDLKGYSVIHLAAHGYVDLDHPQRTGVALACGEGADGYFTIGDVLDLDLDANLVVLSACETAGGKIRKGEGLESIARACLYAGARGVVASLWPVADQAAAETMEGLYQRTLGSKKAPANALREAKLALRGSKGSMEVRGIGGLSGETTKATEAPAAVEAGHPFFWAPFVYIGRSR